MLSFLKHSNRPTDEENMGQHDLNIFTYESVLAATCNFSQENKLGEGGFGPVYKVRPCVLNCVVISFLF